MLYINNNNIEHFFINLNSFNQKDKKIWYNNCHIKEDFVVVNLKIGYLFKKRYITYEKKMLLVLVLIMSSIIIYAM